ncbi:MAG TPA: class I SAM-dependent methyltransferase [Chlamydiales bacterium]|nr:class I SAM-dependent methyltransferase [Chlamydiales bacterium]
MKKCILFFVLCAGFLTSAFSLEPYTSPDQIDFSQLPPPYNEAKLYPFNGHGWYANAKALEKLIKEKNVTVAIEVGSWLGKSTRHIASCLPNGGKIYAVDHWLGSVELQGDEWAADRAILYEQFLSNVIHARLTDKIIPVRMDSESASRWLQDKVLPDLIYIDGGHETWQVYNDLTYWYPYVQKHGVLCGDDWPAPSVRDGVNDFAQEHGLKVQVDGALWYIE